MDDPDNKHRIVFVNADPGRDLDTASDILVIAGLNSAFHYGQNSEELALDKAQGFSEMARVPEIFRFARCAREGE